MRRTLRPLLLVGLCTLWTTGQAAEPHAARPSFEVASIRPAEPHDDRGFLSGIRLDGTSVIMRRVGFLDLLRAAFAMDGRFILDGSWLRGQTTFDILAKLPAGASAPQIPAMIQSLLVDRFKLAYHFKMEDRRVYALVPDNGGVKTARSTGIDASQPGGTITGIAMMSEGPGTRRWQSPDHSSMLITLFSDGGGQLELNGVTFPEFAYVLDKLDGLDIVDATGIKGRYDFKVTAPPDELCDVCLNSHPSDTPNTKESLRRLGLRLEKRKVRVKVLVIDHLEKTPTAN